MTKIKQLWYAIITELFPQPTPFWRNTYVQIVGLVIIGGASLISIFFGYNYYAQYRNEQAQKVLAICLEEYVRAANSDVDEWSTVEMSSRLGYDQHKGTALAPYFLGIQAEALLHQGKRAEAVERMQQMMRSISFSSPLYYLYKTKEYLINLDSPDASTVQAAVDGLSQLAQDTKNKNRDSALYHIGNYYALHDSMRLAQEYWQKLVNEFPQSPWTEPVITQLEQSS